MPWWVLLLVTIGGIFTLVMIVVYLVKGSLFRR